MSGIRLRPTPTGFRFELIASNGQAVVGSEVYSAKAACLKGARSVIAVSEKAPCVDLTRGETAANPRFEIFQDKAGGYRFRLRSRNGKIIAASESYQTRYGAARGVEAARRSAGEAVLPENGGLCIID